MKSFALEILMEGQNHYYVTPSVRVTAKHNVYKNYYWIMY